MVFHRKLLSINNFSLGNNLITLNGSDVNGYNFNNNGFDKPILIMSKEGLRIQVPNKSFKFQDLLLYIGLLNNYFYHCRS